MRQSLTILLVLLVTFSLPSHRTTPAQPPAHNIILLIGDGMGPHHRSAARYLSVGPDGSLAMDEMPVSGSARTYSANNLVTDSAASGTAIASGVKTDNGAVGVTPSGASTETILEIAQQLGKAVGLVTNVQMSHATPAGFAAHVSHRSQMVEIASQMWAHRVDVLLGGGEDEWLPVSESGCYPQAGERGDGRNLIEEAIAAGYAYVCTRAEFQAVDPSVTTTLLGLFADEGMTRPFQPSLAEMTEKAIAILSRDADGFFLMVEGGQIDWASHANDGTNALQDTVDFDAAVALARQFALAHPDTLVIVTADHETGGLTLQGAGDGSQSFSTLGGKPFTVSWATSHHTAVDVPVLAMGPHAEALNGSYENTHIFQAMAAAFQTETPIVRAYLPLVVWH